MNFRTEYKTVIDPAHRIDLNSNIILLGSCFTSNIADRMGNALMEGYEPFGALYNPASILELLKTVVSGDSRKIVDSIFEDKGVWHSWLLDSSFSAGSREKLLELYDEAESRIDYKLREGNGVTLILTFGTAWIYRLESDGRIVANCHKQPSSLFLRERLSIDEIVGAWTGFIRDLSVKVPGLKVIFTISPVRHLKDGFEGNARSKAILQLAVEDICGSCDCASYFPAYEILMDDLRDYRFYASDLVHPSTEAVEYIWEQFLATYFSPSDRELLSECRRLRAALDHRPLIACPATEKIERERRIKLRSKYEQLRQLFPKIAYLHFED